MKIIDGLKFSKKIKNKVKNEILDRNIRPSLVTIIVGEKKATNQYVNMKNKACESAGIYSIDHRLPENIQEEELLDLIYMLNNSDDIDGILIQLPLPKQINQKKVMSRIKDTKDVDGVNPLNIGLVSLDMDGFIPCTPLGILKLMEEYDIDFKRKDICIIGASDIVGKPIANLLLNKGATISIVRENTKNIRRYTKHADIIISAAGKEGLITQKLVKKSAIIIDVGTNISKKHGGMVGDVDFENIDVSMITPVPGGVGPMTIAMLLSNTLRAYYKNEANY